MSKCEFYKIKVESLKDCNTSLKIPYCTHKDDEFSLKNISKGLGSVYKLKCKGDTNNYQLDLYK